MDFPQYRKLAGFERYYRIDGDREFTEVYTIGSRLISNTVQATQYPEILRIRDMLLDDTIYHPISPEVFDSIAKK